MTEAVIFDLDGTLINTIGDLAASTNAALAAYGYPTRTLTEVTQFVGNGMGRLIQLAVPEGLEQAQQDAVYQAFRRHYAQHYMDRSLPYPGIAALLRQLTAKRIRLAVVSNKADPMVAKLCDAFFPGAFAVVMGEQPGLARKPAPDMPKECVHRLGCPPERTIYIGDSEVDIRTAENASLACVAVSWGFRSREALLSAGASTIIDTPAQLLALLTT